MISRTQVCWQDDFLGDQIDDRYNFSGMNGGLARITANEAFKGGWLELGTSAVAGSAARLRLGTDMAGDGSHHLQWFASQNAVAEGFVWLNSQMYGQATFGFVGKNDPDNVLGAALWRQAMNGYPAQWWFQTAKDGASTVVPTGFNAPGPAWMRVETSPNCSRLLINGAVKAEVSTNVPTSGAPLEMQIWSDPVPGGGFWSTTMWVDCLILSQDRQY